MVQAIAGAGGPYATEVLNGSNVYKKRVVRRAAKHLGAIARLLDGAGDKLPVVGCSKAHLGVGNGARSHVVRRHHTFGYDGGKGPTVASHFASIGCLLVFLGAHPRVADAKVRGGVLIGERKRKPVGDVVAGRGGHPSGRSNRRPILNMDFIADILPEVVINRATLGQLKGNVVGDDGHRVRVVRAAESVDVGVVGQRVVGNEGGFAVAGGFEGGVAAAPQKHSGGRSCGRREQQRGSRQGFLHGMSG